MARARKTELSPEALVADRELYARLCLRVMPKEGGEVVPFVLKPEQARLGAVIDHERAQGRPPRIIVLKGRQIGVSTFSEAELFRDVHLRPHRTSLVVAHDTDAAINIFRMSHRYYENLPESIQPPKKYSTKRSIEFAHNDSRMQVEVAGEARSYTAQSLHISELAFMEDAETLMTAILQTTPRSPDSLVIVESTPNGIGNYFHNLWVNAKAGRNAWVPFFSPWYEEKAYRMKPWFTFEELREHDQNMMLEHGLTLEQVAWYVWTRENSLNGDQDRMDQEYATDDVSCFLASGRKVFDADGLRHYVEVYDTAKAAGELPPQVELEPGPAKGEVRLRATRGGRWRIYRPPQPRHRYVLGIDLASGDPKGDWTPAVVLNQHTLGVDAVGALRLPPEVMADFTPTIGLWYNRARVAAEANNHGLLYFHELVNRLRYPNIAYRKVSDESVAGKVTDKPGLWMSGKNREGVFDLVRQYVRTRAGSCIDPDLIREWQELFYDDDDRIDHPDGGSNDFTTALAWALYVHHGGTEGSLSPLPIDVTSKASAIFHDIQVRRSMGLPTDDVPLERMTMDEIQAFDDMNMRREASRKRSGLSGYR